MAHVSPLRAEHQQAEASFVPYGPPIPGGVSPAPVEVVETFGEIEAEYAAIRKGCVLLDLPQRATIEVAGADRLEFLHRMITQDVKALPAFRAARSFWLNRKGRIDADLRVLELGDRALLDLDVHAAAHTAQALAAFVFSEDVAFRDLTPERHRLALHGPTSAALLAAVSTHAEGVPVADMAPGQAARVRIAGHEVIVDRQDPTGEVGLELLARPDAVPDIWRQLLEVGLDHNGNGAGDAHPRSPYRLHPAGWHAFNIARIEAGTPLYLLDFGPESLPHETGVLRDRVSFTKGCYLGQEIVARMEALGQPKQRLVALRLTETASAPADPDVVPWQPVTGAQVFTDAGDQSEVVGAVTSSALSPMLSGAAVCFAQVRTKWTEPGARLRVAAEGVLAAAVVQPALRFWPRP